MTESPRPADLSTLPDLQHPLSTTNPVELDLDQLTDAQLVAIARNGGHHAFAALYQRHRVLAMRMARRIAPSSESDDIVSEAFAQVLGQIRQGKGPTDSFGSYLVTTVRHEAARRLKARDRVQTTDDDRRIDSDVPFHDTILEGFERSTIGAAYAALPERQRAVLWQLDVEGRKPHEIADALGLQPNAVSALVYRARGKLREAYVQQHVRAAAGLGRSCQETRDALAGHLLGTLAQRDRTRVVGHLDGCDDCSQVVVEIGDFGLQPAAMR